MKITHDTFTGSVTSQNYSAEPQNHFVRMPMSFPGFAALVLSLCSNALTVLLIAYKTWYVNSSYGVLTKG